MRPRYTKRVREEAALICAIAASSNEVTMYHTIEQAIGASPQSYRLACSAYWVSHVVPTRSNENRSCIRDAEAEALIRCGWSPE